MDWKTETPPSIQLAHQTLTKLHHFKDAKKSFVGLLRIMVSGIPHIVYIVSWPGCSLSFPPFLTSKYSSVHIHVWFLPKEIQAYKCHTSEDRAGDFREAHC